MRSFIRLISVVVVGTCISGLFSGCIKAPDQELTAAKAAVKAALDVEADKYMPNNYQNVQNALSSAEAEIGVQGTKFFLSRSYGRAKVLLENTTNLATQLKAETPGAKADLIATIKERLATAKEMAKETHVDIRKAPRSKGKEVLAQMKVDLAAAEVALEQAGAAYDANDYLGAKKKLALGQKLLKKIFDALSTSGTEGLM